MKTHTIIGAALLVAAIGATLPPARPVKAATTISFWARDSEAATVTALVKAYNSTHATQVKLTIIPAAQYVTKFGTAVAAGSAPDLTAIDLIYMPQFAAANEMTDITARAKALPFFKNLSPSHMRLATYQGKFYAVPFTAEGSVLLYNKGLFTQAGLNPNEAPKTWSAIESDAKRITKLGNGIHGYDYAARCPGCNAFTFLPLIWASGGDVLSADNSQATLASSPQVKAALTFYHRMWAEGVVNPGAQSDNGATWLTGFETGKVGIASFGAFAIGTLKAQFPKINFGVSYIPGQNGGWSSFAGGDSIGIPRGSQHVNEAWDFVSWCLTNNPQVNILAKTGIVPVRTDLAVNTYSKLEPRYVTTATAMAHGRTPYNLHYNELFNDANGPWGNLVYNATINGQVDQAIATAQKRFTQIINTPTS